MTRDLLAIGDLDAAELAYLLDLAAEMKAEPAGWGDALRGQTLVCCFDQPSTRTRVSLHAAAARLGMGPVSVGAGELQLARGETVADTARVLSAYAAAIAVRTLSHALIEELADAASVPVVNALTAEHHPLQALADLLTLREQLGGLEGRKLVYVGDGNNVARSLAQAALLAGMEVVVATPPGHGVHVDGAPVLHDPLAAVRGADAVYTDVWVSMGDDGDRDARVARFLDFQVDEALLDLARPGAVFLHCLPAHRGEEVTAGVLDGPQSRVWEQAANRLPTAQAVLYALVRGELGARDHRVPAPAALTA